MKISYRKSDAAPEGTLVLLVANDEIKFTEKGTYRTDDVILQDTLDQHPYVERSNAQADEDKAEAAAEKSAREQEEAIQREARDEAKLAKAAQAPEAVQKSQAEAVKAQEA